MPTAFCGYSAAPALRFRFSALAARRKAFDALRCAAWMRLRREFDILGTTVCSVNPTRRNAHPMLPRKCWQVKLNSQDLAHHATVAGGVHAGHALGEGVAEPAFGGPCWRGGLTSVAGLALRSSAHEARAALLIERVDDRRGLVTSRRGWPFGLSRPSSGMIASELVAVIHPR